MRMRPSLRILFKFHVAAVIKLFSFTIYLLIVLLINDVRYKLILL